MICPRYKAMMEACRNDTIMVSPEYKPMPEEAQSEVMEESSRTNEIEGVDKTKLVLMKKEE